MNNKVTLCNAAPAAVHGTLIVVSQVVRSDLLGVVTRLGLQKATTQAAMMR